LPGNGLGTEVSELNGNQYPIKRLGCMGVVDGATHAQKNGMESRGHSLMDGCSAGAGKKS